MSDDNVVYSPRFDINKSNGRPIDTRGGGGRGGGPHDGDVEKRVEKLEKFVDEARADLRGIDVRLTKIESRLEQTPTKADLTDAINGQIKWIVGTAIGLAVAGISVMTFVLNNAVPKASNSPPAQVTITIPQAGAPQVAPAPAAPLQK